MTERSDAPLGSVWDSSTHYMIRLTGDSAYAQRKRPILATESPLADHEMAIITLCEAALARVSETAATRNTVLEEAALKCEFLIAGMKKHTDSAGYVTGPDFFCTEIEAVKEAAGLIRALKTDSSRSSVAEYPTEGAPCGSEEAGSIPVGSAPSAACVVGTTEGTVMVPEPQGMCRTGQSSVQLIYEHQWEANATIEGIKLQLRNRERN